jgi:hypothetical protein
MNVATMVADSATRVFDRHTTKLDGLKAVRTG